MFNKILKALAISIVTMSVALAIQPVEKVDLEQFIGRWYQQYRNILEIEPPGCACAQQTLKMNAQQGYIEVLNSCNLFGTIGPRVEAKGKAYAQDSESNNRFLVDFETGNEPSQYWIIALGDQYRWAVVSDPTEESLFILSKTPQISEIDMIMAKQAAANQVKIDKLKRTKHEGCTYPE